MNSSGLRYVRAPYAKFAQAIDLILRDFNPILLEMVDI